MDTTAINNFKTCNICLVEQPFNNFREKRRMCKKCVYDREFKRQQDTLHRYYINNRTKMIEYQTNYNRMKKQDAITI